MNSYRSSLDTQTHRRPLRFSMLKGLVALVAALQCAPLLADEVDDVARSNVTSTPQNEITAMSGGIGNDAREEMRKSAAGYNVHLVFSGRHGSYLAGIPFAVTRPNGQEIYSGVSEGPLLYLKLPRGSYRIAAKIDGVWQSKPVVAGASGRSTRMLFVAKGE